MKSMFVIILFLSIFVMTVTVGGMTFLEMDHGMTVADSMICIDHCLQAFSADVSVPTLPPLLLIAVLFFFFILQDSTYVQRFEHQFQRWRRAIGTFIRHKQLSTVVLRS